MRLALPIIFSAFLLCACDGSQTPPPEVQAGDTVFTPEAVAASESISAEEIRAVIAEISSDAYEGRGPGSDGDRKTRAYLVKQLEAMGYKPAAADGGWEQPFALIGINSSQPLSWTFSREGEEFALQQSEEFIVGSGVQAERASVENGELVFVGYGIQAPEYQWDDYKGQDLKGKVLVMLNNDPDWDPELFEGERRLYYGRWRYKYDSAARQGAAGAIIIHTTPSAGYPWQVVQTSWTGEQFELPAGEEPRLQMAAWVTEDAARKVFALGGQDMDALIESAKSRDFQPVSLKVRTSITFDNALADSGSANVLGILEGSDPELKKEVVVYTAHHDHLGIGLADMNVNPDDRIYNGARDNASGTASVLAIARAIASMPERPRRSIMIAFVGAEEQGLLGSKYFAANPPVAPGLMAADINYDSTNIWGKTRDVAFVGIGKSSLDAVAKKVADYQGRTLVGDQFPDKGIYYRSDQFSLAAIGVPGLYVKGGTDFIGRTPEWGAEVVDAYTTRNYHQPSDELTDDWNFDGMLDDARFGFWAGLIMADEDEKQAWYPGDEFEAARLKSLEELKQ
jgi:Zn-dependent M28 family amino/carboxypeptidase